MFNLRDFYLGPAIRCAPINAMTNKIQNFSRKIKATLLYLFPLLLDEQNNVLIRFQKVEQ